MNKQQLIALCHKLAKEKNLPFNTILTYCFLEKILFLLSTCSYNDKFIFKGGILLSNIVGVETRSTVDIDFLVRNTQFGKENVERIFSEALRENSEDDIKYSIQSIEPIKEDTEYGGIRVSVMCKLENIRTVVQLDIATGDIITPEPATYYYKSIFGFEEIKILAYPIETIIAEKLQTIYSRGFLNSRSKDYYDLFILFKLKSEHIDKRTLIIACQRTFKNRNTEFSLKKIDSLLNSLREDKTFVQRWKVYAQKNSYVRGIEFAQTIEEVQKLLSWIDSM